MCLSFGGGMLLDTVLFASHVDVAALHQDEDSGSGKQDEADDDFDHGGSDVVNLKKRPC